MIDQTGEVGSFGLEVFTKNLLPPPSLPYPPSIVNALDMHHLPPVPESTNGIAIASGEFDKDSRLQQFTHGEILSN